MEDKDQLKTEETQVVDVSHSEETLLGSVTNITNPDGNESKGQQIRSSARVFKKMKLDLTASIVPEKIEKKEDNKQDTKKCSRPIWTSDDKTMFFDALNEYGKDFENIQMYISSKLRKKGISDNLIKTKDHIRNFYYRNWHKISKYLKFADGIKKITQELYGLINYGELRKKIGSVSEKALLKLNELIYRGITILRVKGRNIRVRTPMCKALRRLNQIEDKYDEIKLPNMITVIVKPKDMASFLKVQCMAQNPKIKTITPLQMRLSSLFSTIKSKWTTVDARFYDKALISTSAITNNCVPSPKISEDNKMILNPPLRLMPPEDCVIEVPSINLSEYLTWQTICLSSYEHRIGITSSDYSTYNYGMFKVINKNAGKKSSSRPRADSVSDKSPQKNYQSTDDNEANEVSENIDIKEEIEITDNPLKLEHDAEDESQKVDKKKNKQSGIDEQRQSKLEKIRKGWTENSCDSITLGEIYLMVGSDSKLILEYSWDGPPNISFGNDLQYLKNSPETFQEYASEELFSYSNKLDVSESLSKLLSVAKLHYRKNIIKCPCGHVCGTKNNARLKKAVESKIRKILNDFDKCAEDVEDKITPEDEQDPKFVVPSVYVPQKVRAISPATFIHQSNSQLHLVSQIDSIRRLKPRYCNRRGRRPRSKQVVVERKLPLLPNRVESDHQIVRMNIITQENAKLPIHFGEQAQLEKNLENIPTTSFHNPSALLLTHSPIGQVIKTENLDGSSAVNLDLINDTTSISSAPSSPSRILKEAGDNQWIASEVADYSLSSLLGHLESPVKETSSSGSSLTNDDSHLSLGSQLHSLLTESSMDFSANFADLAAQVTNDTTN